MEFGGVAVDIRRTLGDLPVCKDIVVATPEEIARRGLHQAIRARRFAREKSSMNAPESVPIVPEKES